MTLYLLKSAVCLLATLLFYKGVLERQNLPRFNRFYLLGSLLFALTAPLVPVEPDALGLPVEPIQLPEVVSALPDMNLATPSPVVAPLATAAPKTDHISAGLWVYGLITILLLLRFGLNVFRLLHLARTNPTVRLHEATVVLLPTDVLPHAFGNYLFVSQSAYESHAIEPELFTHERAHIRQRHTLDILFVEWLLAVGWFNPLLYFFKRAIQLNHEFLADRAVTAQCYDVAHYQELLLSKLTSSPAFALTSTLTFQTTKQRFTMMTKHTSRLGAGLAMGSALVLFAGLLTVVGSSTLAQVAPAPQAQPTKEQTKPAPRQPKVPTSTRRPQLSVAELEDRFGNIEVQLPMKNRKPVYKKFSDLTPEQKKHVVYIAPEPTKTPSEAEFEKWKNEKIYGMWVDGKRTRNFVNTSLKASDIVAFSGSYVHKNARQPEGYLYQMDVMTAPYYEKYLKDEAEKPFLIYIERYWGK